MERKYKVTEEIKHIHSLQDNEVAYWNSLTDEQRKPYYEKAVDDVRQAAGLRLTHGYAHGGEQSYGKGASLAGAIYWAWNDSPQFKAMAQAYQQAYHGEILPCVRCHEGHRRDESAVFGKSSIGIACMTQQEKDFWRI